MRYGRIGALVAGAAALVASAGLLVGGSGAAIAAGGGGTTPPWESTISSSLLGSITFYNAQGQVVTGGSTTAAGLAAYAVASAPYTAASGYTKATLFAYTPVAGQNPLTWSGEGLGLSTNFPNTSAPAPINGTANPVETNNGTDTPLSQYISAFPNTQTTTGYVGLYDIRMKLSGPGKTATPTFYDTVISVDTNTNTWSVDYPDWTQNTTTTLTASPSCGSTSSPITLTAAVSPVADSAGTVSFWDGTTQIGTTQTVSASGTASVTTTPTGATTYTAIFTPTIGSADIGSTGTLSFGTGTCTTTSLAAIPASPAQQGDAVMLTATEVATDNTNPAGQIQFFENGTAIGSPQTVSPTGMASVTTGPQEPSAPNGIIFTATFTPTSTSYISSTGTLKYTVNPVAATPTISGKAQVGQNVTCNEGSLASGVTASYTWQANGKTIGSGQTLRIPASAAKASLDCAASVSDGGGTPSTALSAAVTVALGNAPTPVRHHGPTLSGKAEVGKTLKVNPGRWSPTGDRFTYQWLLNGKAIRHATKSSFKLTSHDKGKKISCRVTAHLTGYANGTATTPSEKVK